MKLILTESFKHDIKSYSQIQDTKFQEIFKIKSETLRQYPTA
jgi:hypothetical protein